MGWCLMWFEGKAYQWLVVYFYALSTLEATLLFVLEAIVSHMHFFSL
jgi:hypothetical protein